MDFNSVLCTACQVIMKGIEGKLNNNILHEGSSRQRRRSIIIEKHL